MIESILGKDLLRNIRDIDNDMSYQKPAGRDATIAALFLDVERYRPIIRKNCHAAFVQHRYLRACLKVMYDYYDRGMFDYQTIAEDLSECGFTYFQECLREIYLLVPSEFPPNEAIIHWARKRKALFLQERLVENLKTKSRADALKIDNELHEKHPIGDTHVFESNMDNATSRYIEYHQKMKHRKYEGWRSFNFLNKATDGFCEQDLSVIAGRPGAGKTFVAMNMALRTVQKNEDLKTAFINLEMPEKQTIPRWLQIYHGLTRADIKEKTADEIKRLSSEIWHDGRLLSTPAIHTNIDDLISLLNSFFDEGFRLFFIDYLQLIKAMKDYGVKDHLRIVEVIGRLKEWKDERKGVHLCCLAQINRIKGKSTPEMDDLQGSSSIEQAAAWVGILFSKSEERDMKSYEYQGEETMLMHFPKNRNNAICTRALTVDKPKMKVLDFIKVKCDEDLVPLSDQPNTKYTFVEKGSDGKPQSTNKSR